MKCIEDNLKLFGKLVVFKIDRIHCIALINLFSMVNNKTQILRTSAWSGFSLQNVPSLGCEENG